MRISAKIDPKWAWHYEALLALREQLGTAYAQHRLNAVSDASASVEQEDPDWVNQANDEIEREEIIDKLADEKVHLADVDAALERLREGTYGICIKTGKPIPDADLRAVPWTACCSDAADQQHSASSTTQTAEGSA